MARFPSMPLFTDAYLADTGHLSDAEHGRYLLLLMHMWRAPECRIPNDDAWLAKRFHRSLNEVQAELRPIIAEFMQCDGNWIIQRRLKREMSFVTQAHEKRSVAAKSRWNKQKASSNAYAPTPTPTHIKERDTNVSPKKSAPRQVAATTLPETLDMETGWQTAEAQGWNHARLAAEFARFQDHARSHGSLYKNWPAAWRNWITSPYQQKPNLDNRYGRKKTLVDIGLELADEIRERERELGIGRPDDPFRRH